LLHKYSLGQNTTDGLQKLKQIYQHPNLPYAIPMKVSSNNYKAEATVLNARLNLLTSPLPFEIYALH